MAERKFRHALISRYKKLAKQQGKEEVINYNTEQWASDSLIESYTIEVCYEMLEYYFSVSDTHSWRWFSNNAQKIYKNLTARKEDDRIRSLMREKAKEWLS
jgi:hypothetical protein